MIIFSAFLLSNRLVREQSPPPTANLAANSIFWAWLMVQQFAGRICLNSGGTVNDAARDVKFSDDIRLHALVVEGKPTKGCYRKAGVPEFLPSGSWHSPRVCKKNGERYFRTKSLHLECRKRPTTDKRKGVNPP